VDLDEFIVEFLRRQEVRDLEREAIRNVVDRDSMGFGLPDLDYVEMGAGHDESPAVLRSSQVGSRRVQLSRGIFSLAFLIAAGASEIQ
jgi:hypothetical protein